MRLDRLGVRLVILLGIALLPLGLIAITQTFRMLNEVEARTSAALMGETLDAASREREMILGAVGAARALALGVEQQLEAPETCSTVYENVVERIEGVVFAGLILADGGVVCASEGVGQSLGESDGFRLYVENPREQVELLDEPAISDQSVIVIREPVMDGDTLLGYVAVSLAHSAFSVQNRVFAGLQPRDVVIFSDEGAVISGSGDLEALAGRLPQNRSLKLLTGSDNVFLDTNADGNLRVYTVAALMADKIFVMAIWPPEVLGIGSWGRATAIAFPAAMWLASLAVAYFAVHTLVIRHIRSLRRSIRLFSSTRRISDNPRLPDMPVELREVTDAFQSMTEQILRDEADLENSIHEKDVLLKEVHHRVKNNLQLIASMTNMQMRKTEDRRVRSILRRLQDRVLSMAAVHRSLYETTSLSEVRADHIVREVATQLIRTSIPAGAPLRYEIAADRISLYPDQMLPLSLLLTEALTNAMKYVGRVGDAPGMINVDLTAEPEGIVQLVVENTLGQPVDGIEDMESSGLGRQLIAAFTMQLGAQMSVDESENHHRLTVRFERSDFSSANPETTPGVAPVGPPPRRSA